SRSSRSQHASSAPPCTEERICSAVHCALAPKTAMWTPHSHSAPQRTHVRRIISSRLRSGMLPRSRRLPAIRRCRTRGLRATVRNRSSGGAPRISLSNAAWISAGYGGSSGAIRGGGAVAVDTLYKSYIRFVYGQEKGQGHDVL